MVDNQARPLIDSPSHINMFGWENIGNSGELAIPVIVRETKDGPVRYAPVKVVEQEMIRKYEVLPQAVFQCITLKSFYLTLTEAKLLNHINFNHCNGLYGESFFTAKDVIISAADVKELARFLNLSHKAFTEDLSSIKDRMGLIRLTADPSNPDLTILVPYTSRVNKNTGNFLRFVPRGIVDKFVLGPASSLAIYPTDWDIMYLRMLSIYGRCDLSNMITKDKDLVQLDTLVYASTGGNIIYIDFQPEPWTTAQSH